MRLALVLWLALAGAALAAPGSWLPDDPPPAGLSVRLSTLTTRVAAMLERGTPDEPALLQREAFVAEGFHRRRLEPVDGSLPVLFVNGDFDTARLALARPGSAATTAPRAPLYRAHLEFLGLRFEQAIDLYQELAEKGGPDAPLAQLMAGVSQLRQYGDPAGAVSDLVTIWTSRRSSGRGLAAEEVLDLAWGQLLLGRAEDARTTIQAVDGALASDPRLYFLYGEVLAKLGDLKKARDAYGTAIVKGAAGPLPAQKYASLSVELKDAQGAAEAQSALEVIHGGEPEKETPRDPWYPRTLPDIVRAAAPELRTFRLDEAERALGAVKGTYEARARMYLGDVAVLRGKPADALDHYRAALAGDPLMLSTRVKLTCALLLAGRAPEALDQFMDAVDLTAIPWMLAELGRLRGRYIDVFASIGDAFAEYLYDAQARLERDPEAIEARRVTGAVLHALLFHDRALQALVLAGRPPEADPSMRRLWAMATYRDAVAARRGLSGTQLKDIAAALIDDLGRAPSPGVEYTLTVIQKMRKEPADALTRLEKLAESGYDAPNVLYELVAAAEARRDFARVKALCERLFRRDYESHTAAVARHKYVRALKMLGEERK